MNEKPKKTRFKTPSELAQHLERRIEALQLVVDGLRGNTFSWGDGEGYARRQILKELGIELATQTAIKRRGEMLTPRARPVGNVYIKAPVQAYADLYVIGLHNIPAPAKAHGKKKQPPAPEVKPPGPFAWLDDVKNPKKGGDENG